jgi:transposase
MNVSVHTGAAGIAGGRGAGLEPITGGEDAADHVDQRSPGPVGLEHRGELERSHAMTTIQPCDETQSERPRLLMAMELGRRQWKLAFTTGLGQRSRRRTLLADAWRRLPDEIAAARVRFGLPADASVLSCYEAGQDGFWLHRFLLTIGVANLVVDSSSIEVNRRKRRAKTDGIDVEKLLALLLRVVGGEQSALRSVRVPSESDEQGRQLHRKLFALKRDRTRITNRIGSLLLTQGIRTKVRRDFQSRLERLVRWDGTALSETLRGRLEREWAKVVLLTGQIKALENARRDAIRHSEEPALALVRRLLELRGIGENAAWLFVMELFAWRRLKNRRQVGAITGLIPTPYQSGTLDREQGISKAGNEALRAIAIQIAWIWIAYQPHSALTQWYVARFADGGPRARKIGIVAVARRLMIDLWRYLEVGVVPEGAVFKFAGAG